MTLLNELHQDHLNLNKLLAVLGNKLSKLKQGELPNFILLADAVDYISNYADRYHHPREDEMYHYFHDLDCKELTEAIDLCVAEHKRLKQYSDELLVEVDCILNDAVVPMDEFIDLLDTFLTHQVEHLNLEEGTLFPLLDDLASAEQWAELELKLPKMDDPLFGEQQKERYTQLYTDLLQDMQ
ncbi:hemerythrin domain-containing protein [Amphritea sp. HPY]|uniref:hemerythrin domain-containing protein n=1 Tax=Amphritea sp. HPY TaxID=3421652 RepID=UPI003D7E4BFB